MAWSTPPTFVSGAALTAAQLNILSADLLETGPAKVTTAGQLLVSTGAGSLAPRTPQTSTVSTAETTTSIAAYGDLATFGPSVTVTLTSSALVLFGCQISNGTAGGGGLVSYGVNGTGTALNAPNGYPMRGMASNAGEANAYSKVDWISGLTAGTNLFALKYTTPTGGTATFQFRDLTVIPF